MFPVCPDVAGRTRCAAANLRGAEGDGGSDVSLEKAKAWMLTHGRRDVTENLSARERQVFDRITRIVLDLDGVVLLQAAKAGRGGEAYSLSWGRKKDGRKTPILFGGVLLKPKGKEWPRRSDAPETDEVRLYLKLSEAGGNRSPWADLVAEDDAIKADAEWRWLKIPERVDVDGEEILDLIEDAYFEVVGI